VTPPFTPIQALQRFLRLALLLVVILGCAAPAPAAALRQQHAEPSGPAAPAALGDEGCDDRFGTPGVYDGTVVAAEVADNGDLYVAGTFFANTASVEATHIARWDGRRWHPLGDGVSGDFERIRQIATHGDTVYVVGGFTSAGGAPAFQLARWDGARWSAVGSGVGPRFVDDTGEREGRLYAVATAPNGDLYVGGSFNTIDDTPANGVARWDGSAWHSLGAGLSERGIGSGEERIPAWVYALEVGPDGSLYAGGKFSDAGVVRARNIARWDGAEWQALGSGVGIGASFDLDSRVEAISVDGARVYAGGLFTRAGDAAVANIAMWDGGAWQALGAGLSSPLDTPAPVLALLARDGALYAGGTFTSAGGSPITGLARWDGTRWSAAGPALSDPASVEVRALAASAGGLFVGGTLERAGGQYVYGIAHWNGERWQSLGQGAALTGNLSAVVNAAAIDSAGRVYVGGLISMVGGVPVNNIAMWDGERWHDMGGGVTSGADGVVSTLLVVGDDLYVGGRFTEAGGTSAGHIARWEISEQRWATLGAGMDDWVTSLAFGGGVLYAGGAFNRAGAVEARDVAAWDGQSWSALGGYEIYEVLDSGNEAGTFARALAYHNGELFIGGHFKTIHRRGASTQDQSSYIYVHNVVGYNPRTQAWFTLGRDGALGVTTDGFSDINTTVYALAATNGGLYIGGAFNRGGGLPTPNLARWDLTTEAWSSPGAPSGAGDHVVRALTPAGSQLLVAGAFAAIGGQPASSVAMVDTQGGGWSALGGGVRLGGSPARVNAAAVSPTAAIFGGEISHAGPHPSLGVARYSGSFPDNLPPAYTHALHLPLLR
jgi:hypothetical protein